MTNKVQKIREEVVRLREQLQNKVEESDFISGEVFIINYFLTFIDSLQEEPVSEELEIAAKEWEEKTWFTPFYMTLDDKGNPNGVRQDYTTHAESFKAGAEWQKQKDSMLVSEAKE